MSFRAYAQVIPIVKRIGIIPRSEPATEAKKNLGKNFTQRAQESALIPNVRTLQQTSNQNTRYSNRTQNHFYINRRPLRGGNLLWASSIQNNFTVPSLASTHTYILKIGANTMGQNHGQYKLWAPILWVKTMSQYKLWVNKYYRRLTKHMRLTTITQTMDQPLLWDDLQSICVQQQYTNIVKRGIDMGS